MSWGLSSGFRVHSGLRVTKGSEGVDTGALRYFSSALGFSPSSSYLNL